MLEKAGNERTATVRRAAAISGCPVAFSPTHGLARKLEYSASRSVWPTIDSACFKIGMAPVILVISTAFSSSPISWRR